MKLFRQNAFGEREFSGILAFLNLFTRKRPCVFCGLRTTRMTTLGYCHLSCAHEFNKAVARDASGLPLYDADGHAIMQKKLLKCAECGRACVEGQINKLGQPLCDDCHERGQQAIAFLQSIQFGAPESLTQPITPLPGAAPGGRTKFLLDPRTATREDYEKLVEYLKNADLSDEERQ